MPTPYAEPYLVALAVVGKPGAVPATKQNYVSTLSADNAAPVVLSGSLQTIAAESTIAYDGATRVTITGSVAADDTAGSPAGGSLLVDIQDNGVSVIGGPLQQDFVANGGSISFTISFVPTAGPHTWQLKARHGDTGDGATVAAHHGQLTVLNTLI